MLRCCSHTSDLPCHRKVIGDDGIASSAPSRYINATTLAMQCSSLPAQCCCQSASYGKAGILSAGNVSGVAVMLLTTIGLISAAYLLHAEMPAVYAAMPASMLQQSSFGSCQNTFKSAESTVSISYAADASIVAAASCPARLLHGHCLGTP